MKPTQSLVIHGNNVLTGKKRNNMKMEKNPLLKVYAMYLLRKGRLRMLYRDVFVTSVYNVVYTIYNMPSGYCNLLQWKIEIHQGRAGRHPERGAGLVNNNYLWFQETNSKKYLKISQKITFLFGIVGPDTGV